MKNPNHPPARRPSRQRGVSMIELLVSLLIFTFGMLGLAGLQTRTLVMNQSSLLRTQATALTDDVLDRMRADRANALKSPASLWDTTTSTKAAALTGATLTEVDLKDWKTQVEALLPSGEASISVVTTAGAADFGTVTVLIQWDDTRNVGERPGASYAPTKFETKTRL